MSVEQIIKDSIAQQAALHEEALAETKRLSDKQFTLVGDPFATVRDLHDEADAKQPERKPDEEVV